MRRRWFKGASVGKHHQFPGGFNDVAHFSFLEVAGFDGPSHDLARDFVDLGAIQLGRSMTISSVRTSGNGLPIASGCRASSG